MRKPNREITEFNQIEDIIKNTNTIRLGISDKPYPYVVPVSFGYEVAGGKLAFYFHGASVGKKVNLLNENPLVCVEGDIFHRYMDTGKSVTTLYESFIAYGKCVKLNDIDAIHGLKQILLHCNYNQSKLDEKEISKILPILNVYKIEVNFVTAKHRTKDN